MSNSVNPNVTFPDLIVKSTQGNSVNLLPSNTSEQRWSLVVVYRGVHCPICADYLTKLESLHEQYADANIDVCAVSADSLEQLEVFLSEKVESLSFPVYCELSVDQMSQLGLYISEPRNETETDHPFPEPAIFLISPKNKIQIIDKSNAPFCRPDLESLLNGVKFIRENDYPVRGTFDHIPI